MMHLHNKLCQTSALYRRWHDHPSHPFVHWALFMLAAGLFTSSFISDVRSGLTQAPPEPSHTMPASAGRIVGMAKDHILVKFKPQADQAAVLSKYGMDKKAAIAQIGVVLVTVPQGST